MLKRGGVLIKESSLKRTVELILEDQLRSEISSKDMCLLHVCTSCDGKCCVGRTFISLDERAKIIALTGIDKFVHWADDVYYLEKGTCPYLTGGRCGVQAVKPFVCQIYPFVPRVIEGELWLCCVGECDAGPKLSLAFIEKARLMAQRFFSNRKEEDYAAYWQENKIGDFDDDIIVFKVKVYD
jgi:Fe-S-cluster containining protein